MTEKVVLERDDLRRTLKRIAHEIAEKNPEADSLAVVGIHTRGALLARRLHTLLGELTDTEVPIGDIDISFYRDDVGSKPHPSHPVVHASHIDFDLSERTVEAHVRHVLMKLGIPESEDGHRRVLAVLAHLGATQESAM